jgi:hypothetical protein
VGLHEGHFVGGQAVAVAREGAVVDASGSEVSFDKMSSTLGVNFDPQSPVLKKLS